MKPKGYLLVLLPTLLVSCATPREQSNVIPSSTPNEPIYVFRFDDHGKLVNREDLEPVAQKLASTPQTVVVFMHGWHGSASPNDNSVRHFQEALEKVRARTYRKSGRKLTGIYLTWNARYLPSIAEYPMYFFTRARADAVARGDGIATVIGRLSSARQHRGREHFIVTGHSFGGRILGRVPAHHPELLRNVDLWLLANAADDSDSCLTTIKAIDEHPYQKGRLPKLVWVTSAKDGMTKFWYEIAGLKSAVGHDRALQTYIVEINEDYSAKIHRESNVTGAYVHNILVKEGLGGHSDVWREPMIRILDFYLFHGSR